MEIAISSATSSANTKNSISLQSGEPDWSMIPSAKKSNKTQAEFIDEIKELARKAANTTSKAELEIFIDREPRYVQNICPMYHRTERHYINKQKMQ